MANADVQDVSPEIAYRPGRPARRRLRRWLLPALLLLVAASAIWWGPPVWYRAQLTFWQSRCAAYEPAPDEIAVRELIHGDVLAANRAAIEVVPAAWAKFYALLSPPGLRSRGTAFLHRLRTPAGEDVLVAVDFSGVLTGPKQVTGIFDTRTFRPGGGARLPVALGDRRQSLWLGPGSPDEEPVELTLFAGQRDPADPTHFTVRYRLGSYEGVIDGWVRRDKVDLQQRPADAAGGENVVGATEAAE